MPDVDYSKDIKTLYKKVDELDKRLRPVETEIAKNPSEFKLLVRTEVDESNEALYTRIAKDTNAVLERVVTLEKDVRDLQQAPMKEVYESKKETKRLIKNAFVSKFVEIFFYVILALATLISMYDVFLRMSVK